MKSFGPPNPNIPARDYTTAIRGSRLSDKKILEYILKGHYGEERRLRALAQQQQKKRREKRVSPLAQALKLLKAKASS